jgi:hypothetical protein
VDNAQPFLIHHGLFTSRGGEVRCTFEERFEDGSRYCFSGVGDDGVGGRWKGEWWKEGGEQGGVWTMEPDEERWREMEADRVRGTNGGQGAGQGQVGRTTRGWRERRATIMGRDLEEHKEVGPTRPPDRPALDAQTADDDTAVVMIEMTDLSVPLVVNSAVDLPSPLVDDAVEAHLPANG